MRKLLLSLVLLSACGEADTPPQPPPPAPVIEEPPPAPEFWEVTEDQGKTFTKAGTELGLVVEAPVTLLGPPLAGTENRSVVGGAKVTEVWPDLASIEIDRLQPEIEDLTTLVARERRPEDAALLENIPEVGKKSTGAHRASSSASAAPAPAAAKTVDVPADLRTGSADERVDALVRYEDDASATAAIVWVMQNDPEYEVRKKAWRVVRARMKAGTGSFSEHESATRWQAGNGSTDMRTEAVSLLGDMGSKLSYVTVYLGDGDPKVRKQAAKATADAGSRMGKQSTARSAITARLEKEDDAKVRDALSDALSKL